MVGPRRDGTTHLGSEAPNGRAGVEPREGLIAGVAVACLAGIANRLVGGLAEKRLAAQTSGLSS